MKNKYLKHAVSFLLAIILLLGCQWFMVGLSKLSASAQRSAEVCDIEPCESTRASTYDPNLYLKENYATYYFSNLSSSFGYNLKGSCCYIALAMMLSYYDTYWDDNIIFDDYEVLSYITTNQIMTEVQSPGIVNDYYLIDDFAINNNDYYYNIVEKNSDYCLHLKLIQMGQEQFEYYNFSASKYPCALSAQRTANLAKYYLYDYIGYTDNQVSVLSPASSGHKSVREFTISMLKQGIPVFLSGSGSADIGHAVVAYDYDENSDTIYTHMGWHGSSTTIYRHNDFEQSYPNLTGAFAIKFNTEHSHSENYKQYILNRNSEIPSEYIETFCPCELSIHPAYEQVVDNHISVKEICYTGTTYRNFAAIKEFNNAMIIELDLSAWLAENNALPSDIKEIKLIIRGKIKGKNNFTIMDITTSLPLDITQNTSNVNTDYITFVPNLNPHNRVRLLVESTSSNVQSYSAYGMSFSVTTT